MDLRDESPKRRVDPVYNAQGDKSKLAQAANKWWEESYDLIIEGVPVGSRKVKIKDAQSIPELVAYLNRFDKEGPGWAAAMDRYVGTAGYPPPPEWPETSEVLLIHKIAEAMHTKASTLQYCVRWLRDWHVEQKSAVLDEQQRRLKTAETETLVWKKRAEDCLEQAERAEGAADAWIKSSDRWESKANELQSELRATQIELEQARHQLKHITRDIDLMEKIRTSQGHMIGELRAKIQRPDVLNMDYRELYHATFSALLKLKADIRKLTRETTMETIHQKINPDAAAAVQSNTDTTES